LNASLRSLAAALGAAATLACHAQPVKVEPFDAQAWPALQASTAKRTVVVFTTTDCVYCPGVLKQLSDEIRGRRLDATLVAVVMDVAPGDDDAALLSDPHHRGVDRLLAFSGQAAALRHGVNPAWRGVTPYIAFLAKGVRPRWVTGPPSAQAVEAWAATPAR
jgi:hypothetical protein